MNPLRAIDLPANLSLHYPTKANISISFAFCVSSYCSWSVKFA